VREVFRRAIDRPQHFVPTAEGFGAAVRVSDVHLDVLEYLLGGVTHGCYRGSMTVFRHDYDLLTGMHAASTLALSCAGTISAIAAVWTMSERRSSRQPRCFRLFRQPSAPSVGVCPGRKQGPEENSHKYLSFAVLPARNVA
jgi:hypothetical protein